MNRKAKYLIVALSTVLVLMLLTGAVLGSSTNKEQEPYRHITVFTEVLAKIKSDYVEEPNVSSVTQGAINGLLESIDPYASYLNGEQYKEYLDRKKEPGADPGLIISRRYGYIGVMNVIPGSPAARSGLATGDIIDSINNISTRDMPLAYAELLLQGKAGTSVELTILRVRNSDPETVNLLREARKLPKVRAEMLPDEIGYISPYSLVDGRVADVAAAIKDLEKRGARQIVLDLRNCTLGDPEAGIQLTNLFVDQGLVTYIEGQRVSRREFNASPGSTVTKAPLVVIVHRGTAGAAEIAASALLASKRAQVVGERTYGDAAVRKAITMDDGGAVILSVAKYYSPDGKAIQDTGVTPSEPISPFAGAEEGQEEPEANPTIDPTRPLKPVEDPMLKKAIELLSRPVTAQKAA